MERNNYYILVYTLVLHILNGVDCDAPNTCDSNIYCYGNVLHHIQLSKIFSDSKTFVDLKMTEDAETIKVNFDKLLQKYPSPSQYEIKKFLAKHFSQANSEFDHFTPSDWTERPKLFDKIFHIDYQKWAVSLNNLWKELGRKMTDDVQKNPNLYSIIYVPNPVIVPGGRFREFYYWDSYWIIRGLLLSDMNTTVKGMLENFLLILNKYGLVPNGGRKYYIRRSQPPLLIPMMQLYLDATQDLDFITSHTSALEKEFDFWMKHRSVNVTKNNKTYKMFRYDVKAAGPRPESYREDLEAASFFKTDSEKYSFYCQVKSAAESGWDFSSRWFVKNGENKGNITDLKTNQIIPVDLNAIMYWNAMILANFTDGSKKESFKRIAEDLLKAVNEVLWNEEKGCWFDYDFKNKKERLYFYASNFAPLWTGCYEKNNKEHIVKKVLSYLNENEILSYPGGVPTSLEESGEQWDFPNAWPPLQHMLIVGLDETEVDSAKKVAQRMSEKWLAANYKGFMESNCMYEKYDARQSGDYGGGGEYEIQIGFGWTNGVCLDLLGRYSHDPPPEIVTKFPPKNGRSKLLREYYKYNLIFFQMLLWYHRILLQSIINIKQY